MNQETALTIVARMPIATMHDANTLATAFAQAHVMGAQNPAEGMLAVTLIHEIGIVKAEATYHIMMGRLTKKAEAILADFVKAGGKYKILQRDATGAKVVASMGETKDATFSFSWDDALQEPFVYAGSAKDQRAELKKPLEQRTLKDKYATPRSRMQMLWARLVSDMGRALCPSATDGMYPPEEVSDFDELQPKAGQTIDTEEVKRRTTATATVNSTNCNVCPDGFGEFSGKEWGMLPDDVLDAAAASDDPRLTIEHKTAINNMLKLRRELP
ncbi:MAG: hypothetical protein WC736_15235 [Gallionella sp.]|jgi:hypothetical protein